MRAALGVQAAAQALGLALGPTLGGLLVDTLGWQWVFWVNVPVGIVAVAAGRFLLPRTRQRTPVAVFDWSGLMLLATATTAILLAVSSVSGLSLPAVVPAILFVLGVLAGCGFVARQRRFRSPLVDLRLLADRAVSWGLAAALGGYLVLFGPLVLMPVALAGAGESVARIGLVVTVLPAGFGLAAVLGGRLLPHGWSERRRCLLGAALCVLALAPMAVLPLTVPVLLVVLALLGIGLGLFTPANNTMVMAAIPKTCSGIGGGLVNMARGLGTALGVAAVTLVLHLAGIPGGTRWVCALLAVVGLAVAVAAGLAGRRPLSRPSR
jgi:MFS family permease